MAKINVDKDLCIACGSCVAIDSETFAFGDDGLAEAISNEINDDTRDAAEACPTDAITIEETD